MSAKNYREFIKEANDKSAAIFDEGKLVADKNTILKTILGKIEKMVSKQLDKNHEKGLALMNTLGAFVNHKVSDKKQEKGKLFLKFGDDIQEDAAVDAANLKAKQTEEMERLKEKQQTELESLKDRHEREMDRINDQKEKEAANKAIDAERESARKAATSEETVTEDYRKVIKMFPRDRDWKKLITKHKRAIDDFRKRNKDLPKKVEDDLIGWASENGEIGHKDEVEDFIMSILDENLQEACWDGYVQKGFKTKNGKQVPNCVPIGEDKEEQDRDVSKNKGTQPKKYYKGLDKDTKQKRDAHFKSKKTGPAPGDEDEDGEKIKTKKSAHTKKFDKMFGGK